MPPSHAAPCPRIGIVLPYRSQRPSYRQSAPPAPPYRNCYQSAESEIAQGYRVPPLHAPPHTAPLNVHRIRANRKPADRETGVLRRSHRGQHFAARKCRLPGVRLAMGDQGAGAMQGFPTGAGVPRGIRPWKGRGYHVGIDRFTQRIAPRRQAFRLRRLARPVRPANDGKHRTARSRPLHHSSSSGVVLPDGTCMRESERHSAWVQLCNCAQSL